jgi:hypothetical protein
MEYYKDGCSALARADLRPPRSVRPEGALARGIYSLLLPLALGIEAGWPKRREAVRGEAGEPGLQGNAG